MLKTRRITMTSVRALGSHQHLLLLALCDHAGTVETKASCYQYALAGALLVELRDAGCIEIAEDGSGVDVVRACSFEDRVLADALATIESSKRRSLAEWVSRFASDKDLRHPVAEHLCRLGILENRQDKVLLVFSRTVYPTLDPAPEQALLASLRGAVMGSSEPDPKLASVIALAQAAELLGTVFSQDELNTHETRIDEITAGHGIAQAVREILETDRTIAFVLAVT